MSKRNSFLVVDQWDGMAWTTTVVKTGVATEDRRQLSFESCG